MKILLLGDYSGLHVSLAEGLRELGHAVVVASDGDSWKNYPRDIDMRFNERFRRIDVACKLLKNRRLLKGFDVVQLINPIFFTLRAENNLKLYKYIQKQNKSVFLGANGDDFYYLKSALSGEFSSSVFNHNHLCQQEDLQLHIKNKLSPEYKQLNEYIAHQCNGITACCTEYQIAYDEKFGDKLKFIPLPVKCDDFPFINTVTKSGKVRFFLGIQEKRKVIKGMDVIYEALLELQKKYSNDVELQVARSVPFEQYKTMLDSSHILCDQLYSYGNGMNGVMAMAKGLIVAGGGEEEMYNVFGEEENKPIINLPDTKEGVIKSLESLLDRRDELPQLAKQSRVFALKHHDYIKVAQQYLDFWESRM